MSDRGNKPATIDLRWVAAATAVAVGVVAAAALIYLLVDIFLLLFVGIVVAAALQPWHVALSRRGFPRGIAVLVIYLLLLVGLGLIILVVGPLLLEQVGTFTAETPSQYASMRAQLQASPTAPLRMIGQRLPPFDRLVQSLTNAAPEFYQGAVDITTTIVTLPAYLVTVLAIAFYWTMEVPRFERLVLSMIAVEQRPRTLSVWHDIESKLGGFMRGQGLAMLSIGVASAVGYALIGLPNVLVLAGLAGLLEAVPIIGPVLGAVPAVLVALPMGTPTILLVIGFAIVLQFVENNLLIPRIMHSAVGVNALVGLLAVLAFGTLYGVLGVLVAIPVTAVIQVLFDTLIVNVEPLAAPEPLTDGPWTEARARVHALRQRARARIRTRTTRMGIDPASADHVVDAADQQIEAAAARVEALIAAAEGNQQPLASGAQAAIVDKLRGAIEEVEQAIERDDTAAVADKGRAKDMTAATAASAPELQPETQVIVEELNRAAQRFTDTVQDIGNIVAGAQGESAKDGARVRDVRTKHEPGFTHPRSR